MELKLPKVDRKHQLTFAEEIQNLGKCLFAGGPVCQPDCPESKRRACSRDCPEAAQTLTSDKEFPVERGILPLVFELRASRVFQPIWSCEGHCDAAGDLFRTPSVWFCCEQTSHVRVLADALADISTKDGLSTSWRLALCCPGHTSPLTIFSLEPDVATKPSLAILHDDIARIASQLRPRISRLVRSLRTEVESGQH